MFKILIFSCVVICAVSINLHDIHKRYVYKNNKITADLLYRGAIRNPGENFPVSVYSLSITAALLALFAEGKTNETLLKFLNLRSREEIRRVFPAILDVLRRPDASQTLSLNAYTDVNNRFCPAFSYEYKKLFAGKTRVVNYGNPERAAYEINKEVKSEGSGGFKELIYSGMIKKGAGLHFISTDVLTTAYKKFEFSKETKLNFKSGNKVTVVPGMTGEGLIRYAYIKSLDVQTVEFAGPGNYTYHVVYPNNPNKLLEVMNKLRDPAVFEYMLGSGKEVCAKISLISISYIYKVNLGKSARESNYLQGFFEEGGLELRGVTNKCSKTYISSILHEFRLQPEPIKRNTYKVKRCSKYSVQLTMDRPHLYFVTISSKLALAGVVVNVTTEYN